MASRDFPGRVFLSNETAPICIFARATFAADAQANGAAVARGGAFTSALTRTGEGLWTWDLADNYPALLYADLIVTKADTQAELVSESVATDGKINFRITTAGNPVDPDSATAWLFALLANSSEAVG